MRRVLERLLNLLAFLLDAGRPVTAEEIRTTVAGYDQDSEEAFRRMFERDKDVLRGLGIPLERRPTDAWEVDFGYMIPRDAYELPDPELTDEERAALTLAAQVVRLGGQPSGPEALFKLGGVAVGQGGEPLAADLGSNPGDLALLFQAVTERRLLRLSYRGRARELRPYALVHQRGHWYLLAGERGSKEARSFRVDRISELGLGDRTGAFQRPKGFQVRRVLPREPWEAGEEDLSATVHFDPEVAWWARRQLPPEAQIEETDSGALTARLAVANPDAFVGWMLSFGAAAEVVEPPQLRELVVERVRGDR